MASQPALSYLTRMAERKVLVESARAASLAAHSAAGLCAAHRVRTAERLLRLAEAMSRAAVASLVGSASADDKCEVQVKGKDKQLQPCIGAQGEGCSRSSARRRRRAVVRGAAAAAGGLVQEARGEVLSGAEERDVSLGGGGLGFCGAAAEAAAPLVSLVRCEGGGSVASPVDIEDIAMASSAASGSAGGLAEVQRLCAAKGPEAVAMLERILVLNQGKAKGRVQRSSEVLPGS